VQPKSSEPSVLGDALRVMVDDGERVDQERHTLATQRCRCAIRRLGHVKMQMRLVGVPRIADRAEHLGGDSATHGERKDSWTNRRHNAFARDVLRLTSRLTP